MEFRQFGRSKFALIGLLLFSWFAIPANAQQQPAEAPVVTATKTKRRSTSSLLPSTTRFWVSVEDLGRLETNISNTQLGKLARQDTLAPFFASFEKQIRDTLDNNGIKFGLDVASIERMQTGEVSIAGVLPDFAPGVKPAPRSHGVVVLIDVSPDVEAAKDFLSDAAEKMEARGAKQGKATMLDTEVSKWTVEVKAAKINRTQTSFVTIVDGWLVASDNESIFSSVLRNVKSKGPVADSLGTYEPFVKVDQKTAIDSIRPDLKWFVDPLGYARFADALAEENSDVSQPKDRPLEALAKEGLDALKAAGGFVSFSTGEHDLLLRTLVYADKDKAVDAAQKRLFELLDFAPAGASVAVPPKWIPDDAAGYSDLTWDLNKAFENVGPLVDTLSKPGTFESIIEEMKKVPDFKVDIRKMVQSVGNRITVVAATEEPIDASSEKMIIGVPLKDGVDGEWLIQSIGRAVKGKIKKLGGYTCVIDDRTEIEDSDGELGDFGGIEIDDLDDLDADDLGEDDIDIDPAAKAAPPRVTIFNRRIMVIRGNYLFVCNDKEYLKKFLSRKPSGSFKTESDLTRMNAALAKVSKTERVVFRMFNRLDEKLKTDYEMLRTGKMAESETFVARILNQIYGQRAEGDEKRIQQIDGSDLPSDFAKEIAPFLGQSGLVMETTDSGWLVSGCVLPKPKAKAMVAEVPGDSPEDSK